MKLFVISTALAVMLLSTGCVHKGQQAQTQVPLAPPIEDAPLPKPNNAPPNLPPPVISVPEKEKPATAPVTNTEPPPPPAPKRKKPSPSKPAAQPTQPAQTAQAAQPTTEQAANTPPEVPAIGNLASGDPVDLRDQTVTMISDTEKGLRGLNRKLNDQEQKTSAQIREFLKQARTALSTNDVDGAHTLAVKAKVLLGELSE